MSNDTRMGLMIAAGLFIFFTIYLLGPFVLYMILDKFGGFSGSPGETPDESDDEWDEGSEGRVRMKDYLSDSQIEYLREILQFEMDRHDFFQNEIGLATDSGAYRRALGHLAGTNPSMDDDDGYIAVLALERHLDDRQAVGVLQILAPSYLSYGTALGKAANPNAEPREAPMDVEQRFWSLYEESLLLKNRGHLASALAKRKEALALCDEVADQPDLYHALRGMAYHNIAILAMYHLGDGELAASAARKSLQEDPAFLEYSEKCRNRISLGAHLESLQTAAITATSYDESISYLKTAHELHGDDDSILKAVSEAKANGIRWGEYQFTRSQLHFSRESAAKDKGDYAPGMAYLQTMLDHAEEPAYDLSYEEYEDTLDTYATITVQYLVTKAMASQMSPDDFSRELAFIADAPLSRIADFLPDCQPSDRPVFDFIIKNGFRTLPGVEQRDSFAPFR